MGDLRCALVGRQPVSPFPMQLAPDRPNTRVRDYEPSGLRAVTDTGSDLIGDELVVRR